MNIGFIVGDEGDWNGGVNYFNNLFASLALAIIDQNINIIIFTGNKNISHDRFKVVHSNLLKRYSIEWFFRMVLKILLFKNDYLLLYLLESNNINILSHYQKSWKGSKILTISWIPDFQHKYLPYLFSKEEIIKRDNAIKHILKNSDGIIVSSKIAKSDLNEFFPNSKIKKYVLNFYKYSDYVISDKHEHTLKKYQIKNYYFFVPNQFWEHKNHSIIIEAIAILKTKGLDPLVICSGSTVDYRNNNYFNSILEKIKINNLSDNIKILGRIPYDEVMDLYVGSIAIINPSLFEGWSTSVEEGKYFGKKIILSNIKVHLEQNPAQGFFFDPHNAEELVEKMEKIIKLPFLNITTVDNKLSKRNAITFANNYINICNDIAKGNQLK